MRTRGLGLVLASLTLTAQGTVKADTLDFEGLTTVTTWSTMHAEGASTYDGFVWQSSWQVGFSLVADAFFQLNRPDGILANTFGAPSASYAVFNMNGTDAILVQRGELFDFHGASFAAYGSGDAHWTGPSGPITISGGSADSITVRGYRGFSLVGSASMSLSPSQYDWLQADLFGVDTLVFERTAQPGASNPNAA